MFTTIYQMNIKKEYILKYESNRLYNGKA